MSFYSSVDHGPGTSTLPPNGFVIPVKKKGRGGGGGGGGGGERAARA